MVRVRRGVVLGVAWVSTTIVAVVIGVLAVTLVGASLRDRGPVGAEVGTEVVATPTAAPSPTGPRVRERIEGDWGAFVVECRETYAYGVAVEPDRAAGWRVDTWQKGPDDDVDAVFGDAQTSVTIEVFCNRGRPTLADVERDTLGDDD
jgi:hypothetical protein